jgi:DNA invertase Pin-like site-specific DNA recombinase
MTRPSHRVAAAEYVRMSTEGQQYSIAYQQLAIRQYALTHGMEIVCTYSDEHLSGLTFARRPALVRLLNDVMNRRASFHVILIYDVSRWGRFQDTDESAHYEYLCRKAGIRIEYCAEPFDNNSGPLTSIYKSIKRAMAAEYSREQSIRVHRAMSQAATRGYFTGGSPGLGFSRMLVGADGKAKGILKPGERRDIRGDHMILVPGPRHEVEAVQRMFHLFVRRRYSPRQVREVIAQEFGLNLHVATIQAILRNERYIGTSIYNHRSAKLKGIRTNNPRSSWITVPNAFPPIVSSTMFQKAQELILKRRHKQHTQEALLDHLRLLLKKHGKLSVSIIRAAANPDFVQYRRKFGGARQVYARLGYIQGRDRIDVNRAVRRSKILRDIGEGLAASIRSATHSICRIWPSGLYLIDDTLTLAINAAPYFERDSGPGWYLYVARRYEARLALVVRLDAKNEAPNDFLLISGAQVAHCRLWLTNETLSRLGAHRCATLAEVATQLLGLETLAPRITTTGI